MAKKINKSQVLRHIIQCILFLVLPGLYAMTFSELKIAYQMIIGGKSNFLQAIPNLIEFIAVMLLTIIMGRWFCGWLCAFGSYNDLVYFISRKIFKRKFKVNEKVDSILKYVKYIVLTFIIIVSWTIGSKILESTSPWDAFAQITDLSTIFSSLFVGFILLVLITIGAAFIERFFCRYLCPLGAVFAIISRFGITKINKPKDECGKCRACTINCSMGLKLYKVNGARGGDCINCLKCTEVCPRNNAKANILGQDVNENVAGSVAMAAMLGIYGITNFGADALTSSGIITNNNVILSDASSNNALQKYKDGTYTGTGEGFRGGTTKVSVTIADGKITDIKTLSNGDDRQYFDRASGTIIKNILSTQSTSVDIVTGATFSSNGIISAVKDALSQASVSDTNSNTSNDTNVTKEEPVTSNVTESPKSSTAATVDNNKTTGSNYKDGTYTGTGTGFEGATTKISVTIANGKINNIKTISNGDTPDFYNQASNGIINKIISTQSPAVDTVSGATYSSNGIISAVKNALNQASGSASNSNTSSNNVAKSETPTPPPVEAQKSVTPPIVEATKETTSKPTPVQSNTNSNVNTNTSSNQGIYKDGTYAGSGQGFRGGTTKVSVTIANGKITNVETLSNGDTPQYYNRASGTVISSIISKQSTSVDTVSGATYSSKGIMSAVANALSKAK